MAHLRKNSGGPISDVRRVRNSGLPPGARGLSARQDPALSHKLCAVKLRLLGSRNHSSTTHNQPMFILSHRPPSQIDRALLVCSQCVFGCSSNCSSRNCRTSRHVGCEILYLSFARELGQRCSRSSPLFREYLRRSMQVALGRPASAGQSVSSRRSARSSYSRQHGKSLGGVR